MAIQFTDLETITDKELVAASGGGNFLGKLGYFLASAGTLGVVNIVDEVKNDGAYRKQMLGD